MPEGDPPPPYTGPLSAWRDRIESVLHDRRALWNVAAGALLVIGVAVAALALLRPATGAPPPELSLPMVTADSVASSAKPAGPESAPAAGRVIVHAAGAVLRPGLYRLAAGARVDDLVSAAGGLAVDADADRVNLAALLSDGQRVYFPRRGEVVPADVGAAGAAAANGPVNLNTATEEQLDALPGVGPATAKAIVAERSRRGGRFQSVEDLLQVRGIGPAKLEALRDLVTVG